MCAASPPPRAPALAARRAVLGGVLAAVLGVSTGCRIRLEDDAPALPLLPTREPIPAETALLWLLTDSERLARSTIDHADLYRNQVAVLRTALVRAGVPVETLDDRLRPPAEDTPTPSPTDGTGDPTDTPTLEPEPTASAPDEDPGREGGAEAGEEAAAALARIDDLSRCGAGLFPLVTSILAQRWAAVDRAGANPADSARLPEPARIWRFPHLARPFAAATEAAAYGLEIVAAQTQDATRLAAEESLDTVRLLRREQSARAGGSLDDPAAGYTLPFQVDSEESAQRLGTHVLAGLVDAYGGLLTTVTGSPQPDVAPDVVSWLGAAAVLGARWQVPVAAFPGLRPSS